MTVGDESCPALLRYADARRARLEDALRRHLPETGEPAHAALEGAIRHAVFAGGKRWRPMLTFLGAELVGGRWDAPATLELACAVEYLHAASLTLDDLPSMDDARLRRGQPTPHTRFGEDVAILAAVALLMRAVELAARCGPYSRRAAETMAAGVGVRGMVGGQAADLAVLQCPDSVAAQASDRLHDLRNLKTAALIELALVLGATAAGATPEQIQSLRSFAERVGQAYQILDDVLDVEGDATTLGKPTGLDASRSRFTYASDRGVAAARARVAELARDAEGVLVNRFGEGETARTLGEFAQYVAAREH